MRLFQRILLIPLFLVWLCVNFPLEARSDPPLVIPTWVSPFKDVNYVPNGHNPRQVLDLFVPDQAHSINHLSPVPLIIWIHGGGWRSGYKTDGGGLMSCLLRAGFAVASIEYRLTPEANFPAQVNDVKAAVRFLRANAEKYHLNAHKIGAIGMSAGGHLVAILGTTSGAPSEKTLEGNLGNNQVSSDVQAVSDWSGPIDFLTVNKQAAHFQTADFIKQVMREFLGDDPEKIPSRAKEASPASYAKKGNPPFLIVHGDKDELVPYAQAQDFFHVLKAKQVPVSFFTVVGGGHGTGDIGPAVQVTIDFFSDVLCGSKAAFLSDKSKFPSALQE